VNALLKAVARTTPRTLGVVLVLVAAFVAVAVLQFRLTVFGASALYFVVWWTLLFAILPIRNQAETRPEHIVPGQDPGAPAAPRLREKAIWTTLLTGFVFLGALAVFPLAGL
jgi:predicted secreted protein